jgi:hypothetical protein
MTSFGRKIINELFTFGFFFDMDLRKKIISYNNYEGFRVEFEVYYKWQV